MSAPMAEATRHLILIKHAPPTVVPGVPPSAWTLAEAGRASCATLAQRLARYNIAAIATSDEPKARETAELLATNLGFHDPIIPDHELREHERRAADFYPEQGSFEAAVRDLFARPDEVAFGAETATAARERHGNRPLRRRPYRHRAVRPLATPRPPLLRRPRPTGLSPGRDRGDYRPMRHRARSAPVWYPTGGDSGHREGG